MAAHRVTRRAVPFTGEEPIARCGIALRRRSAGRLLQRHDVSCDRAGFLFGNAESGHAPIRNALEDQTANGFERRCARTADINDVGTVSATGSILTVAADTAGLVRPLAGIGRLGGGVVHRNVNREREDSCHGTRVLLVYRKRTAMRLRIMASRHSIFYSPLLSAIAGGFLERQGLEAEYSVLGKGQRSSALIREGAVDVMQSAVSSNWKPMERGETELPVHFATINEADGFFLVAREPDPEFNWKKLEGHEVLADHGLQPLVMLRYAVRLNQADCHRITVIDAGTPEEMEREFRRYAGDYVHLQSPAAHHLEADGAGYIVASVGVSMPPVAFSSL